MHSIEKKIYLGLLVCLLVSVIGTSFAYFVAANVTGGAGGEINAAAADLINVKYDAGIAALDMQNVMPNTAREKNFTVTITPTSTANSATYAIYLNITANTFVKCTTPTATNQCTVNAQELVYSLLDESDTEIASGDLTEKTGKLQLIKLTKSNLSEATTYNYKLKITYKDTGAEQNHNFNKSFVSSLNVEFAS